MKIRTGFVSNSSSASYYVSLSQYETVFDMVRAMWQVKFEYWDDPDPFEHRQYIKIKEDYAKYLAFLDYAIANGIDPNTDLMYLDDNYDTYIYKRSDGYHIYTNNNIPYGDVDGFQYRSEDDIAERDYAVFIYILNYGLTAREFSVMDADPTHYCADHHPQTHKIMCADGSIICPICHIQRMKPSDLWVTAMQNKFKNPYYVSILRELYPLVGNSKPIERHHVENLAQRIADIIQDQLKMEITKK